MKGLAYERLCVVFCCLWGIPNFSGLRRPQIWGGTHPKFGTVVPMWFSKLGRTEKGGLSPYNDMINYLSQNADSIADQAQNLEVEV